MWNYIEYDAEEIYKRRMESWRGNEMETLEQAAERIKKSVEEKKERYIQMNDDIWEAAEVAFQEVRSCEILIEVLQEEGFEVEKGIDGMPTAFLGSWGTGRPVIGLLAEYDALPGMSQVSGIAEKKVYKPGMAGHGCGHNTLGVGAVAGAIAVKNYMDNHKMKGTIRIYGCPGEESGWSKVFLARDGYFDDLDACFNWHPGNGNYVRSTASSAIVSGTFTFHGKASHAAASPHLGRSALDACELMSVGVNYLREHIIPEARVHYAYQDAGGKAPNVVQDYAVVKYLIRAPKVAQAREVADRVADVARGAALMTGTKADICFNGGVSDFLPNDEISRILSDALMAVGGPGFDDEDRTIAKKFHDTYGEEELNVVMKRMKDFYPDPELYRDDPLIETAVPYAKSEGRGAGSTDVGDVSYCTPTALLKITSYANGTAGHSWQLVAQMAASIAHKALICAAQVLALAVIIAMESPERLETARKEYEKSTGGKYISPIGADIKPAI